MKRFQKILSIKSIISGFILIILGAIFFIISNNKMLAYALFIGGLIHFLIFAFMLYKNVQTSKKNHKPDNHSI